MYLARHAGTATFDQRGPTSLLLTRTLIGAESWPSSRREACFLVILRRWLVLRAAMYWILSNVTRSYCVPERVNGGLLRVTLVR
jgi:hypothetical protein